MKILVRMARCWSDLNRKLPKEGYFELYENILQLKSPAAEGKFYATDCATTGTEIHVVSTR